RSLRLLAPIVLVRVARRDRRCQGKAQGPADRHWPRRTVRICRETVVRLGKRLNGRGKRKRQSAGIRAIILKWTYIEVAITLRCVTTVLGGRCNRYTDVKQECVSVVGYIDGEKRPTDVRHQISAAHKRESVAPVATHAGSRAHVINRPAAPGCQRGPFQLGHTSRLLRGQSSRTSSLMADGPVVFLPIRTRTRSRDRVANLPGRDVEPRAAVLTFGVQTAHHRNHKEQRKTLR